MKHDYTQKVLSGVLDFSALGRAVWDETLWLPDDDVVVGIFQCSRSSRMG